MQFAPLIAVALSAPAFAANTWYVDPLGGGDFRTVVDAVAAAADGDRIVVASGLYDGVTTSKRLHVVGPAGGVFPAILTSSEFVGSSGIHLSDLWLIEARFADIEGECVLHGCSTEGTTDQPPWVVENCASVVLDMCRVDGTDDNDFGQYSGGALRVTDSYVEIVDCLLTGGDGFWGAPTVELYKGEEALEVFGDSVVVVSDSLLVAGAVAERTIEIAGDTLLRVRSSVAVAPVDWGQVWVRDRARFEHVGIQVTPVLVDPEAAAEPIPLDGFVTARAVGQVFRNVPGSPPVLVGHRVEARLFGPAGSFGLLLASATSFGPIAPVPLATSPSSLWLTTLGRNQIGATLYPTHGIGTPAIDSFVVPDVPGIEFWIQAVTWTGGSSHATNPALFAVGAF